MFQMGLLVVAALLVAVFLYHRWRMENLHSIQERLFQGDVFEEEIGAEILFEPHCRHLRTVIEGSRVPYLLQNMNYRGEGELRVTTRMIRFKALMGPETFYIPVGRVRGVTIRPVRRWGIPRTTVVLRWQRAQRGLVSEFLLPPKTAKQFETALLSILRTRSK
jgi:hypothetical protein